MDKRYQVFISSTFLDLQEERSAVYQTVMEMDCIPAGMELFPAIDDEQFNFIKRIIDDSDYYILIIGGRYGSIAPEGISFTEKEYDYAIEKGIKVIALLHGNPGKISVEKSDTNPETLEKLESFKTKVTNSRLVKTWTSIGELQGLVATGLNKTIKTYPGVGWKRANTVGNVELLNELNELRKENKGLKEQISSLEFTVHGFEKDLIEDQNGIQFDLANLDDIYGFDLRTKRDSIPGYIAINRELMWGTIFKYASKNITYATEEDSLLDLVANDLLNSPKNSDWDSIKFSPDSKFKLRIQFQSLGLIQVIDDRGYHWKLTDLGEIAMINLWTSKKDEIHDTSPNKK